MADATTCGEGLAQFAGVPIALAELSTALSDMLEHHVSALDPDDQQAQPERDAYFDLTHRYRAIADQLFAAGQAMSSYRSIPECRHSLDVMMSQTSLERFRGFIDAEGKLADVLLTRLRDDEAMLREMEPAKRA
jgi:hypothetical protein